MSLDNAAGFPLSPEDEALIQSTIARMADHNPYATLSDRELLEHIARNMDNALAAVQGISKQVGPMVEAMQKNPLLRGLFRG